jgi:hypothetical protein
LILARLLRADSLVDDLVEFLEQLSDVRRLGGANELVENAGRWLFSQSDRLDNRRFQRDRTRLFPVSTSWTDWSD